MERFKRVLAAAAGTVCAALLAMGVIGNLFLGNTVESIEAEQNMKPVSALWEEQYTMEQMQTTETVLSVDSAKQKEESAERQEKLLENQVAALRMKRDSSWQRLQNSIQNLEPEEQKQMQSYTLLQYKEQRLEVLLEARGVTPCLVLLEEQQANILADEKVLAEQPDRIFDLVQRNSEYQAEQIILVPLKTENNVAG